MGAWAAMGAWAGALRAPLGGSGRQRAEGGESRTGSDAEPGSDGAVRRPPRGRRVAIRTSFGRGVRSLYVRELPGPPGAPVVVLLHGWVASGGLNWFRVFEPLARHFRVIALDQRGHGRGIRSPRFRLEDCADDVAGLLDVLGVERAIAVGYSMGGAVAQLVWRRHRERVAGLVLCATGPLLVPDGRYREVLGVALAQLLPILRLTDATRLLPALAGGPRPGTAGRIDRLHPLLAPLALLPHELGRWAVFEMARHDLRMLVEAGRAIHRHDATGWIHTVDAPTAVVVTKRDRGIDPRLQRHMAERIARASVHEVDDGHVACARATFAAPLLTALHDVAARS